jgi:hypothetical protein
MGEAQRRIRTVRPADGLAGRVAIDLKDAAEPAKNALRMLRAAPGGVEDSDTP